MFLHKNAKVGLTIRIRLTGVGILDVVSYDPHVHISGLQVCPLPHCLRPKSGADSLLA
jgi:hypothetical protein